LEEEEEEGKGRRSWKEKQKETLKKKTFKRKPDDEPCHEASKKTRMTPPRMVMMCVRNARFLLLLGLKAIENSTSVSVVQGARFCETV